MEVGTGIYTPPTLVTRGVMVSYDGWGEGHHFKEAGGAVQEVLCNLAELFQGIMDFSGQHYPLAWKG